MAATSGGNTNGEPKTNRIRDTFGVVSVTGMSLLTLYAIAKLTPVWKRNLDQISKTSQTRTGKS